MLSKWSLEDINKLFEDSDKVVIIDQNKEYEWLIEKIRTILDIKYFLVSNYLEDLEVKYLIEKEFKEDKVLIHTYFDPNNNKNWHYMVQEYASTGKTFKKSLSRYIDEKSGLRDTDIRLLPEELILAGKLSLFEENDNQEYWDNIKAKGKKAIFGDFSLMILKFLSEPGKTISNLPDSARELFYELISVYLEYQPDIDTLPEKVAAELGKSILDNLINNIDDTKEIYKNWIDSHKYRDKLIKYIENYKLPKDIDIWNVNPDHPFKEIDERWLKEISDLAFKGEQITSKIIDCIRNRAKAKLGIEIAKSEYWPAICELLTLKVKPSHKIEDINDFIEIYKKELFKLDKSLRVIYQHLLSNERIRKGFKAIYEEKINPYIDRWFSFFPVYKENQSNYIYNEILKKSESNIAIIIGDAISYEISQEILESFKGKSDYEIDFNIMRGNFPTTTKNNMSSLFGCKNIENKEGREKSLKEKLNKDLKFYELDKLNIDDIGIRHPTIIYSRDIDEISEKGNESALKYYDTFINNVKEKIKGILAKGFDEVYLITDHGFVYNFDVDESDKFEIPVKGKNTKIYDRFILTNEDIKELNNYIKVEKDYEGYKYILFPKGIKPIKSKGKYGFAHGGIAPQEILLPHLKITKKSKSDLKVWISNKSKLKEVGSNSINIKIEAEEKTLFNLSREVIVRVVDNKNKDMFSTKLEIKPCEKRTIPVTLKKDKYKILILDMITKERLDYQNGKKIKIRGGLDDLNTD